MSKVRQQRTAEQIRLILSELLLREVRDPRLHNLTVTRVDIDRELQHAHVYVNALGDESRRDEVLPALEGATGFFRSELARRMDMRTTPQLHFHWDPTLAYTDEIYSLLDSLDIPPADEGSPDTEQ